MADKAFKEWGDAIADVVADAIDRVGVDPNWQPPVGDPSKMFRVKVVSASVGSASEPDGRRAPPLYSFRITAPRIILAEINTHCVISKSSESSRAMPGANRVKQVAAIPYRPLRFAKRKAGMGAGEDLSPESMRNASAAWEVARAAILAIADKLLATGLAKEEFNRLLEPWALCRTILTGTEWANFYALRTHDAASPPFRFLARAMWIAASRAKLKELNYGEWHMPFVDQEAERPAALQRVADLNLDRFLTGAQQTEVDAVDYCLLRWSAARCARISYGLPDGKKPTPEADDSTWANLTGFDRTKPDQVAMACSLNPCHLGSDRSFAVDPIHASPMAHQGTPLHPSHAAGNPWMISNLRRWFQFRRLIAGETIRKFQPPPEVVKEWEDAIHPDVFDGPELY